MPQDKPTAIRPQDIQATLAEYLAVGVPKRRALKLVGVAPQTFDEWMALADEGKEPYLGFKKAIEAEQNATEIEAMKALRHHMKRNWSAAKAYLDMIDPETYDKAVEEKQDTHTTVVQIMLPDNGRKGQSNED